MKASTFADVAAALKKDADLHGDDPALAVTVAHMTETAKAQSRVNIRACAAELRATLRKVAPDDEPSCV